MCCTCLHLDPRKKEAVVVVALFCVACLLRNNYNPDLLFSRRLGQAMSPLLHWRRQREVRKRRWPNAVLSSSYSRCPNRLWWTSSSKQERIGRVPTTVLLTTTDVKVALEIKVIQMLLILLLPPPQTMVLQLDYLNYYWKFDFSIFSVIFYRSIGDWWSSSRERSGSSPSPPSSSSLQYKQPSTPVRHAISLN